MSEDFLYNIVIVLLFLFVFIIKIIDYFGKESKRNKILDSVNNDSYQKYAKFYGDVVPNDDNFEVKVNNILNLIKQGEVDIKEIAKSSHCTYPECVLKIKYLKNKRLIGDYYIDTDNLKLLICNKEDEKLLKKYKVSIYNKHLSVEEMADHLYKIDPYTHTKDDYINMVFKDLKYLDSKNILNGVILNDVDKTIKYYTIEKKKETDLVTVHCPNCGALNDVDVDSKTRCSYCNTIIMVDKDVKNRNFV